MAYSQITQESGIFKSEVGSPLQSSETGKFYSIESWSLCTREHMFWRTSKKTYYSFYVFVVVYSIYLSYSSTSLMSRVQYGIEEPRMQHIFLCDLNWTNRSTVKMQTLFWRKLQYLFFALSDFFKYPSSINLKSPVF
jgi:hypothetical protein